MRESARGGCEAERLADRMPQSKLHQKLEALMVCCIVNLVRSRYVKRREAERLEGWERSRCNVGFRTVRDR